MAFSKVGLIHVRDGTESALQVGPLEIQRPPDTVAAEFGQGDEPGGPRRVPSR